MSAAKVLGFIGSPDFVQKQSRKEGWLYVWTEVWEYDFRQASNWSTLRITWEGRIWKGKITAIEWITPYWLDSDAREAEFLRR